MRHYNYDYIKQIYGCNQLKFIIEFIKNGIKSSLYVLFKHMPLQNKIVFCNFNGRGYGDDPKYISEEIIKRNIKTKLIWITNLKQDQFPSKIKAIQYGSIWSMYHLFTARIWVFNTKNVRHPQKRKGQFYIQTWHGGIFGLKKVEKAIEKFSGHNEYLKASKIDSTMIDLMYSDNDFIKHDFETNFWYNGIVLKCGIPRESILITNKPEINLWIRNKYNIPDTRKIILYAPTFRGDLSLDAYKWNYQRVIKAIEEKFNCSALLLLRLHPNIVSQNFDLIEHTNVINVSDYPDMQELLSIADFCISDYSSSYFEFACLRRKPVFLLGLDYDFFTKNERSFHLPLDRIPFHVSKTVDDLCNEIHHFDDESYNRRITDFCNFIGLDERGDGSATITDIIVERLRGA